jgi:uncharacterized protein YkwD
MGIGILVLLSICLLPTAAFASSGAGSRVAACQHATTSASTASVWEMRVALLCLVNQERKRFQLPLLRENAQLDRSAQGHSDDMVTRNYFSHYEPNGIGPSQRMTAAGYHWSWWGENIATGYPTPASVMQAWMSDVGHCQNILKPQFRDLGIGENPHGIRSVGSGPATWTQDFGLPAGASPPSNNSGPANGCPRGL